MSELTASHCGCTADNRSGNNSGCNWIWIIILLFLCNNNGDVCGIFNNNSCDCGCDNNCGNLFGGNGCSWIWIIILFYFCCNNHNGCC